MKTDEQLRLQELYDYKILDTPAEHELNELAEIASAICETPISLLSLLDKDRQWFKAVHGLDATETPREVSFCQHLLHNPTEVLVVEDALHDERFSENPFVTGNPNIRFYAGVPLVTPAGYTLGTLCVIDTKPRQLTGSQQNALLLLAKKAMDFISTRKRILEQEETIGIGIERLIKISDQAPGAIYELEMQPNGKLTFPFISKGFAEIHPELDLAQLKENAEIAFSVVHPDDVETVKSSLETSYLHLSSWDIEYRVLSREGEITWHWAKANPEKREDGTVVWYGTFQDITTKKEYRQTLEQIIYDISHVMRRPVVNMLGLTTAINEYNMEGENLRKSINMLQAISEEMDQFMKQLNEDYYKLKSSFADKMKYPS